MQPGWRQVFAVDQPAPTPWLRWAFPGSQRAEPAFLTGDPSWIMPPTTPRGTPSKRREFAPERMGPLRLDATLAKVSNALKEHEDLIICWCPAPGNKDQYTGVVISADGKDGLARIAVPAAEAIAHMGRAPAFADPDAVKRAAELMAGGQASGSIRGGPFGALPVDVEGAFDEDVWEVSASSKKRKQQRKAENAARRRDEEAANKAPEVDDDDTEEELG